MDLAPAKINTSTPKFDQFKRKRAELESPELERLNKLSFDKSRTRKLFETTTILDESNNFPGFTQDDLVKDDQISPQNSSPTTLNSDNKESTIEGTLRYIDESYDTIVNTTKITGPAENHTTEKTTLGPTNSSSLQNELLNVFEQPRFGQILQDNVNKTLTHKLEIINKDLSEHADKINDLNFKVDKLDQLSRANNLLISGIPDNGRMNTDLKLSIIEIAEFLGISLVHSDLTSVYRIPSPSRTQQNARMTMVKFLSKAARDEFYSKRAQLKNFTAARLYINEDLTPTRASFYSSVREQVKALKLFSCFTKNGDIFVKLTKISRPIKISDLKDLNDQVASHLTEI
jgi:hypothetical protein